MGCSRCGNYLPQLVKECPFCGFDVAKRGNPIDYYLNEKALFASRYRLEKRLGFGSWSQVFQAYDTTTAHDVALKILKKNDFVDENFPLCFLREAKRASIIQHQNIVNIYDLGQFDDYFYVSEELIKTNPDTKVMEETDIKRVIGWAYQVANGLSTAHNKNILHLDLHPGNILITNSLEAKLTDFCVVKAGWGKAISEKGSSSPPPSYLAPELLRSGVPTKLTDIYAYGVVFYWLLTKRLPFNEPDFMLTQTKLVPPIAPIDIDKDIPDDISKTYTILSLTTSRWQTPVYE